MKLQRDQNLSDTTRDEVIEQAEEIPDQPSHDEMRSKFKVNLFCLV